MKKRFVALFCALTLLFCIPMSGFAATGPELSAVAELSDDGKTVTVTVSVSGGSALCGGSFDIVYDAGALKCKTLVSGAALAGSIYMGNPHYSENVARCGWMGVSGLSSDGIVAVATFELLSGAEGKKLSFTLTEVSGFDASGGDVAISAKGAELSLPGSGGPTVTPTPVVPTPSVPDTGDDDEAFLMEFADVPKDAYYYDAVKWAVGKGITTGTSDTTFSPRLVCTRAQAVTFLWRAAGSPAPKVTSCPFTDVSSGAYYYKAVLWAVEKGITTGTSATTFSPNTVINRAQTVTFLYRAAGSPAVNKASSGFTDVPGGAWYENAVIWAVGKGVTTGTSATTFSPGSLCTRGQMVTFLYRA